ncbi:MAG: transposase [Lachnospiraceae bacterium]|nr:transposase [Lachnospiraceae bacterium]
MSRQPRRISATNIYHVILRSVNQQQLFEDVSDFQKFLYVMQDCSEKYECRIYAYCLMSNHIHMLVNVPEEYLSSLFKSIGARFAGWYNKKYARTGYLFQSRFFSKPVETQEYFLRSIKYIHDNPVKANMCRYPTEYNWSSSRAYYGAENPLVECTYAINLIGSAEELRRFFSLCENEIEEKELEEVQCESESVIQEMKKDVFRKVTGCANAGEFQQLPKVERNACIRQLAEQGFSYGQISRLGGIPKTTVSRIVKS